MGRSPKGADSMAISGLHFGNALAVLLCTNVLRNSPLALHGAHFRRGSIYPRLGKRLPAECRNYCQLVNGWVWFESRTCKVYSAPKEKSITSNFGNS